MLNLLQKSILYVEEQNAWLSHLQSSIAEKEGDYNSLHTMVSNEIIVQVEKLKSADADDVKVEENEELKIKEECPDFIGDVQLKSNGGIDVTSFRSESKHSKNSTKVQGEDTSNNNSLALVPRHIVGSFEQLCQRFGVSNCGSLPPMLQMLLKVLLYIETQNDWFIFLQCGIGDKEPDYQLLHSMLSKGILDELTKQNVDIEGVRLKDGIVIKEEYSDVTDDIQPTNNMEMNTDEHRLILEYNNPSETTSWTNYSNGIVINQQENNEEMKIVEVKTDVAIIKEQQDEDVKEEPDDEVEMNYDSSSDYVPEEEDDSFDHVIQSETYDNKSSISNMKSNTENNPQKKQHGKSDVDEKSKILAVESSQSKSLVLAKVPVEKIKTRFECSQCKKTFSFRSVLHRHMHTHSGEKPYKCTYCNKSFTRRDNCNLHMRIHTGERVYKCIHCEKSYIQIASLNWHIRRTHNVEKLAICGPEDVNKDNMQMESYNHSGGKLMLTASDSNQPSQSKDGKSFRECSYCKKAFIKLSSLERHMRTHTDDKQSQCSYCGKLFKSTRNLIIHMRIHTGEKPFTCPFCESTFKDSTNRNRHVRTHTGEKPFKCDYCDKTFCHSGNRKQHMLVHTGEKPYKCSFCDKTFRDRTNCKRHMQTHSTDFA